MFKTSLAIPFIVTLALVIALPIACSGKATGLKEKAAEQIERVKKNARQEPGPNAGSATPPTSLREKKGPLHGTTGAGVHVTDIEITQGIQNLANDIPLVEERVTYARVYVDVAGGRPIHNVSAELCGSRDGQNISCVKPENNTANNSIIAQPGGGDRLALNDSFFFYVPVFWRHGEVTFTATVTASGSSDTQQVKEAFHHVRPMHAYLVPVHLHQTNPSFWIFDDADNNFDEMKEMGRGWGKTNYATSVAFGNIDNILKQETAFSRKTNMNRRYQILGDAPKFVDVNNAVPTPTPTFTGFIPTKIPTFKDNSENFDPEEYGIEVAFGDIDCDGRDELAVITNNAKALEPKFLVYDDLKATSPLKPLKLLFEGGKDWDDGEYATSIAFGNGIATPCPGGTPKFRMQLAIGRHAEDKKWRWRVLEFQQGMGFIPKVQGGEDCVLKKYSDFDKDPVTSEPNLYGCNPTDIAFGNFDGVGTDELAVTLDQRIQNKPRYYIFSVNHTDAANLKLDTLWIGGKGWPNNIYPTAVAFGDVNGDGDDEMGLGRTAPKHKYRFDVLDHNPPPPTAVCNSTTPCKPDRMIQDSQGLGTSNERGEKWGYSAYPTSLAFGDVDGDGRDELGIARMATSNARYFILDDALAGFDLLHSGPEGWGSDSYATAIAFGDVDKDGKDEFGITRKVTGWGNEKIHFKDSPGTLDVLNSLYRYHPIAALSHESTKVALLPFWHWADKEWDIKSDEDWVMTKLAFRRVWDIGPLDTLELGGNPSQHRNTHHLAIVHPVFHYGGLGTLFTNTSISNMRSNIDPNFPWHVFGGVTTAHEFGHNQIGHHAHCEGDEPSPHEPRYPHPFPNCQLADIDPAGFYGFDVYHQMFKHVNGPTVISNDPNAADPHRAFPMMSYKSPRWIDPFGYCELLLRRDQILCPGHVPASNMAWLGIQP
jgi:hypothetical protein